LSVDGFLLFLVYLNFVHKKPLSLEELEKFLELFLFGYLSFIELEFITLIRSNKDGVFKPENNDNVWCLKHISSNTYSDPPKSFKYFIAKSDAYLLFCFYDIG